MQVEKVDFVSFLTQDLPRAKRFSTEVLGLEGDSDLELRCGQVTLDIFDPSSRQPFSPSPAGLALRVEIVAKQNGIALRVPDVHGAVEEVGAAGGEVTGIEDTGVCHMGFVKDPDGNVLILHRRHAPREKRGPG